MSVSRPALSSRHHLALAIAAMIVLLVASVAIVTMIPVKPAAKVGAPPTPPAEVMNTNSSPDAGQPCNYLTHEGDPASPDRIILWCDSGKTALVINTAGLERYVWKTGEEGSVGNGSHHIDVTAGGHTAYLLVIVQLEDGTADYRVWYDDKKVTTEKDENGEVTSTESRITMRNFTREGVADSRALGY